MRYTRRCCRRASAVLSMVLSAALVTGSIPTTALAEMLPGDAPETTVVEFDSSGEDLAGVGEILPQESEAVDASSYDDATEPESDGVGETSDADAEASAYDVTEALSAPSANEGVGADAEARDHDTQMLNAASVSEITYASEIEPVSLTIPEERGQGEQISLAAGESWVGEFVAPEDWTYVFGFVSDGPGGTGAPDVTIYADRGLTQELASQTASTDSLKLDLSEGEAVYVVVKETEGAELSRTFAVTYDHDMTVNYPETHWRFLYDGHPHRPEDVSFLSDLYTEGTHFVLSCFRDAEGNESLDAPTEVGVYTAVYRWIGDYRGFATANLEIVAPGNLADTTLCWSDGTSVGARSTVFSTGNPTYEIEVKDLAGNELVSGTDYDLVYYTEVSRPGSGPGDPGETERIEYPSAPTEPGTYNVCAKAAVGSSFTGQSEAQKFTIVEVEPISDISFETTYRGTLDEEHGIACYTLTLPSGGRLDADSSAEGENIGIWLYGTKGEYASEGLNGYFPKGTYYAIVSGEGKSSRWEDHVIASGGGEYSFSLTFTSARESFPRELGEPAETKASANPIHLNTAYRGLLSLSDRTDFYRFSLNTAEEVTLAVDAKCDSFNTRILPIDFTLYDSSEDIVWIGNTYSPGGEHGAFIDVRSNGRGSCAFDLDAGEYTLRVRRPDEAPWVYGVYEFSLANDEAASLSDATIAPIPDQEYTGKPIEPELTVTLGDVTLTKGTDYEVAYENNTSIGTASATVTGIGAYVGSISASFKIVQTEGTIATGTWGTCPWEISKDGKLTIHPGTGASQSDASEKSPWDEYAANITSIVLSGEGEQKVVAPEDSSFLFANLTKVKSVDVSGFDTSGVASMGFMFNKCSSLTTLNLSSFDTSSVTEMWFMFLDCSALTTIDLSGWNTKNVQTIRGLFQRCRSLTKVDVSGWDTSSLNDMGYLFLLCTSLSSVDLTPFNTVNVYSMSYMFENCSKLKTIYVGKGWTTSGVLDSNDMFSGCQALVGGNGTVFSTEHTDAGYAHIDTAGKPGYLTLGPAPAVSFNDVSAKTPHADDITWLASSGISTGWKKPDGTVEFRPTNTVIRQDMAAFLFRLAKSWNLVDDSWQPSGTVTFTDVSERTPHYREIMWLAESGVSAGWKVSGGREFRPTNTVVRQDMAAFLRRLQALRDPSVREWQPAAASPFRDVTARTPHRDDILWLAESGVSAGWNVSGGKEFRPTSTVIRQDMAAFLHRLDGMG